MHISPALQKLAAVTRKRHRNWKQMQRMAFPPPAQFIWSDTVVENQNNIGQTCTWHIVEYTIGLLKSWFTGAAPTIQAQDGRSQYNGLLCVPQCCFGAASCWHWGWGQQCSLAMVGIQTCAASNQSHSLWAVWVVYSFNFPAKGYLIYPVENVIKQTYEGKQKI